VWDDHVGAEYSSNFHHEEFCDACGVPGTDIAFLGMFEGIFCSDDNGRSWKFLDTLSHCTLYVGPQLL
jgi:hypothetical protein